MVFDTRGVVRPVNAAIWSGLLSSRTTKQIAKNGDLVLRHEWYPSVWKLYEFSGGVGLVEVAIGDYTEVLKKLPKELDAWMATPTKAEESFLPAGCGWDGVHTKSALEKLEQVRVLFSDFSGVTNADGDNWLDDVCRRALVSPQAKLDFTPTGIIPPTMTTTSADDTDEWCVWYSDGRSEIHRLTLTEGWDFQEVPMPTGVYKAIHVSKSNSKVAIEWHYYSRFH